MSRALDISIVVWLAAFAVLHLLSISGAWLASADFWSFAAWLQHAYSPFHVWTLVANVVLLAPAVGAMVLRDRLRVSR